MKHLIYILVLVLIGTFGFAQKPIMVKGHVFDSETGEPVSEVHISIKGSDKGTTTDKDGFYTINFPFANETLVYTHVRYQSIEKTYQASNFKADIIFEPLINILPDAIVKPVVNISKGMLLDVTDYHFMGDSILYAGYCYRYNKKNNPWIVLIGPKGDTILTECVGMEGSFYKDCMNNLHYLTKETAYQIIIENDSLWFEHPTAIKEFESIMYDCMLESNNKVVLRQYYNKNQILIYYHTDKESFETEIFRTISDEVKLNMLAYQGLFFSMGAPPNAHDLRFEEMMFNPVFAPIIKANDTISIINYCDSKIEWYDSSYNALGSTKIHFHNSKFCRDEILVDEISGRVYALYLKNGKTSVREIYINSGAVGNEISIPDFAWIDNIKVHNNQLFFLYRTKYSGELRALFRMFLE